MNGWTEAQVERLKELWLAGRTLSQIAQDPMFRGRTRQAIGGRVSRLGVTRSVEVNRRNRANGSRLLMGTLKRDETPLGPSTPKPPSSFALPGPLPNATPRPWLTRKFGECAFPHEQPDGELWSCCLPVATKPEGSRYCKAHRRVMYGGQT